MNEHLKALLAERSEPVRLTVGFLKGGSAKSTTALFLALALARHSDERVLLVDTDERNGTSFEWSEFAGDDWPSQITVVYWPVSTVSKRIRESGHTGHVVIDTGPERSDSGVILRQALTVTDHLVLPLTASPAEASRIQPTLEVAAEVGISRPLELNVLFTRVTQGTVSLREARAALVDEGLNVLPSDVPFKQMYSQAFGTVPDDLGVYPQVLAEILEGSADE